MNATVTRPFPNGIDEEHIGARRTGWTNPTGVIVLSLLVAFAFLGAYGREHTIAASGAGVDFEAHLPERIRNGELFEMRFTVLAHEAVSELVIAVDASVWEDMTINTFMPGAAEETSEAGRYRFSFGPMAAGTTFDIKVDGQINPDTVGGNSGVIGVYDGERLLVELPVEIGVLP